MILVYYFVYHSVVFSPCYFQENNKPILGQHNPVIDSILVAGRLPYAASILYHFGADMKPISQVPMANHGWPNIVISLDKVLTIPILTRERQHQYRQWENQCCLGSTWFGAQNLTTELLFFPLFFSFLFFFFPFFSNFLKSKSTKSSLGSLMHQRSFLRYLRPL